MNIEEIEVGAGYAHIADISAQCRWVVEKLCGDGLDISAVVIRPSFDVTASRTIPTSFFLRNYRRV